MMGMAAASRLAVLQHWWLEESRSCQRTRCCSAITARPINTEEILLIQFESSRGRFTRGCLSLSLSNSHWRGKLCKGINESNIGNAAQSVGMMTQWQWDGIDFLFTRKERGVHCDPVFVLFRVVSAGCRHVSSHQSKTSHMQTFRHPQWILHLRLDMKTILTDFGRHEMLSSWYFSVTYTEHYHQKLPSY